MPNFPPGFAGQLPWNHPPATPPQPMQQQGQRPPMGPPMPPPRPPMGPPQGMPPGGQSPMPPPQGAQPPPNPLRGLPGAPGGAPAGALGAPAQQPTPMPQGMPQPMGMAAGGRVPKMMKFMPRTGPTFGHVMQAAGVRRYDAGGAVRPVLLRASPGYASGGLVQAADKVKDAGRWEDTAVVHLNPAEMQELAAKHGPPTINPETGLPEFGLFSFLGNILKVVAPIAALAIPGIGEALAPALEGIVGTGTVLGTSIAADLGSALAGAGLGAITGGGKGALIGGLTGGLGSALGPTASAALGGGNLGNALVSAGLGAGASAAGGGNPLTGALLAGGTSYLFPQTTASIKNAFSPTPGGASPSGTGTGSGLGAVTDDGGTGVIPASALESDSAITPSSINAAGNAMNPTAATPATPAIGGKGSGSGGIFGGNNSNVMTGLMLASLVGGLSGSKTPAVQTTPPPASNAPAYFGQQFTPTPYAPQVNAAALQALMNNPRAYASQGGPGYYQQGTSGFQFPQPMPTMAKGGALKMAAQHLSAPSPAAMAGAIKGPGTGISDEIPARLARDEHVLDAEFVSSLGDGSSDAGHERIEKWKAEVRKKKRSAPPDKIPKPVGALAMSLGTGRRK